MKEKKNNAGFSLIEVVLSMAVLAIISIPMLSYFSNSAKYNAMMADKQHATALAQEVLENLKNEEHLVQLDGTSYTVPYLLSGHYSADSSTFDASGIGTAVFYGQAASIGEDYDVMVTVQTNTIENTTDVTLVSGMDDTCDALAVEGEQYQEALVHFTAVNAAYASNHAGAGLARSEIEDRMQRTIGIDVQESGGYYAVKVDCTYTCSDLQGSGSTDSYICTPYVENRLSDLRRVYVLYQTKRDSAARKDDKVEVTLGAGVTKKPELYFVCQNLSMAYTGYQLQVKKDSTIPVYTNIGKNGKPGQVANEYGIIMTDTKELNRKGTQIRKINIEVSVYRKGKAKTPGEEPYITVNTSKGE